MTSKAAHLPDYVESRSTVDEHAMDFQKTPTLISCEIWAIRSASMPWSANEETCQPSSLWTGMGGGSASGMLVAV